MHWMKRISATCLAIICLCALGTLGCQCICKPTVIVQVPSSKSCGYTVQERCPTGYSQVGGKCYLLVRTTNMQVHTNSLAKSACNVKGGQLVSLENNSDLNNLAQWLRAKTGLENKKIDKCTVPLDIIFVIDESSSVKTQNFEKAKTFIANVAGKMDIGQDSKQTRVGVITYSDRAEVDIYLKDCSNLNKFKYMLKKLKYFGGLTYTGRALRMVKKMLHERKGSRKGVKKIVVLLTDGRSGGDAISPAQKLKDMGIKIVGVGIGNFNERKLKTLVSDDLIKVDNYNNLNEKLKPLLTTVCKISTVAIWIDESATEKYKKHLPPLKMDKAGRECVTSVFSMETAYLRKTNCNANNGIVCQSDLIKIQEKI